MREGGIFDLPSALGIEVAMSDAVTEMDSCNLSGTFSESAQWLQNLLKEKGALSLVVDGKWGPCSESAFYGLFGVRTSQASVAEKTGLSCAKFVNYYGTVGGNCNGSDIIYEQQGTPPPAPTGTKKVAVIKKAEPKPVSLSVVKSPFKMATATPPTQVVQADTAGTSKTWIYVIGGLALLGIVGFFFLKKKSPAPVAPPPAIPNRRHRRRSHRIRLLK
ncbi:MAG: LPXTG cell wall anchor domain-containing protein [bacterium]